MTNRPPKPASDTAQPPTSLLDPRVIEAVGLALSRHEFDGKLPSGCDWKGLGRGREEGAQVALTAALAALDREALIEGVAPMLDRRHDRRADEDGRATAASTRQAREIVAHILDTLGHAA